MDIDDDVDLPKLLFIGSAIYSGLTTSLHPLNVIKTRAQAFSSEKVQLSRVEAVRSLMRTQGVRGLYAGLVPVLAGALPARAGYILALEGTRPRAQAAARLIGLDGASAFAFANGCSGLAAATASLLIYVPADVVSQRMMVTTRDTGKRTMGGEIRAVYAAEGVRGFFRGFWISAATGLPAGSIWWAAYGYARRALPALLGPTPDLLQTAMAGTFAAGATVCAVAPLDTLKTRTQLAGSMVSDGPAARSEPVWRLAARLARQDGLFSLYAGSLPRFAHLSLWGTALVTVYEELKRTCRKPDAPPPAKPGGYTARAEARGEGLKRYASGARFP